MNECVKDYFHKNNEKQTYVDRHQLNKKLLQVQEHCDLNRQYFNINTDLYHNSSFDLG